MHSYLSKDCLINGTREQNILMQTKMPRKISISYQPFTKDPTHKEVPQRKKSYVYTQPPALNRLTQLEGQFFKASISEKRRRISAQPPQSSIPACSSTTENHNSATNLKPRHRESIPQLLRRIFKLVVTLSRVSLAIRKYAVSKTDSRTLTDIHSFLRRGKDEKEIKIEKLKGLLFDKTSYSVENNHKFPYWARNLCSYPPEFREKNLLLKMQRYLRGIHNFSRFTKEAQMEICRHVIYSRYDKLRVILSQVSDLKEFNDAAYSLVFSVIFTRPEYVSCLHNVI